MKVLILYSGKHGQTAKIANIIADHFNKKYECHILKLDLAINLNLQIYQLLVIGSAVYYGKFSKMINIFINKHIAILNSIPSAFYAVNLTARKIDKCTPMTNPYTKNFLLKNPWKPNICAVFAGSLCYEQYYWFIKIIIKYIMFINKEKTNLKTKIEYTDWTQVIIFAIKLQELIKIYNK